MAAQPKPSAIRTAASYIFRPSSTWASVRSVGRVRAEVERHAALTQPA